MMASRAPTPSAYDARRENLAAYFDKTARQAWIDLTSDAKVSGIRATVRAGREAMRATLMSWLPEDLRRSRVLDAGCGTGALATLAACRGAEVTGVDIAGGLIDVARERSPGFIGHGKVTWKVGDMTDPALGAFDHVVAMDSLIHYDAADIVSTLSNLGERCHSSMVFTFAPHTRLLGAMHKAGKFFPRSDRAPAIIPVTEGELHGALAQMDNWRIGRTARISSGFYTSQALELVRHG